MVLLKIKLPYFLSNFWNFANFDALLFNVRRVETRKILLYRRLLSSLLSWILFSQLAQNFRKKILELWSSISFKNKSEADLFYREQPISSKKIQNHKLFRISFQIKFIKIDICKFEIATQCFFDSSHKKFRLYLSQYNQNLHLKKIISKANRFTYTLNFR